MIAMLEEAEDVLRRVGCDMTAANIRKVLQAQQAEPRCACGDSFTSDAVCANCLATQQQAEPVARDVLMALGIDVLVQSGSSMRESDLAAIADRYAAQPPAVAVAVPQGWSSVSQRVKDDITGLLEDTAHAAQYSDQAAGVKADYELAEACKLLVAMLAAAPLSAALADIAAERRRQIEQEGWTPEHDDAHSDGQMATAAACYAISAHNVIRYKRITMPSWWPWDSKWWKPGTTRRDLVKAGALIAAEIERIDRAAQKGGA